MISDPNLIRYACVAHQSGGSPTILVEYNSGEASLQTLANECLLRPPPHHSIFSHTIHRCAYTFVIVDDPFVYFAVSDVKLPKPNRIWFLKRLKEAAQHLIAKHGKSILKSNRSFTSYCFQSQIQPVLHQLMSTHGVETEVNGMDANSDGRATGTSCKTQSKRIFAMPLLAKVGEGLKKKKKRLIGDSGSDSKEVLVENKIEMSDQIEVASRDCHQKGAFGSGSDAALCLGDSASGAKQKAKRIWRRHVWVVLGLDFAVCLILFGVWLMVCHGFQCVDG